MSNYKQYLGDSVYVDFDGYHIVLTTEQGDGIASNTIYLEPYLITAIERYRRELTEQIKSQEATP